MSTNFQDIETPAAAAPFTDRDRARALKVLIAKTEAVLGLSAAREGLSLIEQINQILKTALQSQRLAPDDYRRLFQLRKLFASTR
jgi:hypothetical protein